ncbi:MAG: DUF6008 family protein [Actinomycetota bacterium]
MSHREYTSHYAGELLKYLAVGTLTFQLVHLIEHVAQLGYWIANPFDTPWLTPWAVEGRDVLAIGGDLALGNEFLHLLGNIIFLAGLVALVVYSRRQAENVPSPLRAAMVVQGLHGAEHVALTATTAMWGKAAGLSTFFGLVSGPVMTSYRVWFHFLINLVATWFAARAVMVLHSRGLLVGGLPALETTVSEGS